MTAPSNILAIVGRPNVGKSALFNRIVGRRVSIVHEEAGVTRDRVSAMARWNDKTFEVVDTGGIAFMDDEKTADVIATATRRQAEVAIEMAGVLIMVVDVTAGVTLLDKEIARKLRSSGKKIFLAVNKVDHDGRARGVDEFAELGLDQMFPIAAIHGLGVETLVNEATADFTSTDEKETVPPTRIAIVGRPNVGKSSLINSILQSERTIVSEIAGTTRDSVDVPFTLGETPYVLVDTAGLRHKRKIATSVDQFGLMRAERSIEDCDVAVLVIDALEGVTKQDQRIGGLIAEAKRACVILVNKWDLAAEEERKGTREERKKFPGQKVKSFRDAYLFALRQELFFLDWAPVLFVSAKTGQSVRELFRQVSVIEREMNARAETPELNRVLARAMQAYPPQIVGGRRLKVYYAFQKETRPPTFTLFVNSVNCLVAHYERYLASRIREKWSFTGCPVVFELRPRERRENFFRHEKPTGSAQKRHGEKKS